MAIDTYRIDTQGREVIDKDPGASLDYSLDLTAWLATIGDALATVNVVAPGATVVSKSFLGAFVIGTISGGALHELVPVTLSWTTTAGRADSRTIYLNIKQRSASV